MPVAAMATMPAPANCSIGMNASRPIARHEPIGVCHRWRTFCSIDEIGSWLSRDMPKQRRIVEVSIERQQTKIAAETTSRNTVENALPKFASMMFAGPKPPLIAAPRFGIASRQAKRNTAPITNAPITEASTAFGASVRGLRVSSASVDAVSNP